ncbi:MAG: tRNA (adenosine(37)-N6)-threonylcarbamoyltransferase complex ATPase subunit type 1 TsaE [Gemmatimonadota bacterium]|nr:tRNA (adenosine(37)-N6)-threonylcarbamoyltransferase complex ATPase subunit type 1 TsaE [Gemmatimonadota bacterium]
MQTSRFEINTTSPDQTRTFGRELSARLRPGDCVGMIGELGSGKTCLAQGICEGFGVQDRVTSPTFILVNEYRGRDAASRPITIYHFDLYRLPDADALIDLGWDDYLAGNGICLIEWAERAGSLLPERAVQIRIEMTESGSRRILLENGECT